MVAVTPAGGTEVWGYIASHSPLTRHQVIESLRALRTHGYSTLKQGFGTVKISELLAGQGE